MLKANSFLLITSLLLITMLGGCKNERSAPSPSQTLFTVADGWPKKITSPYGNLTLNNPPKRIVSTSVSLTGTLLAIDAPVIASGGTRPDTTVADAGGFFRQWSAIAKQRRIKPLYQGVANAEAIAQEKPDLIIVSATGGDSAVKIYQQLAAVAPTVVVNYDDKSWQELARLLASITDRQPQAEAAIAKYEHKLQALRNQIVLPPQPVTAMTYYEDGRGGSFWTPHSAQGKILTALGFQLSPLPDELKNNHQMGKRKDIVPVNGERFADAITGQSIILFAGDDSVVQQIRHNKFISHLPPVQNQQIYAMGNDSFRLDFYSSMDLLAHIEANFTHR